LYEKIIAKANNLTILVNLMDVLAFLAIAVVTQDSIVDRPTPLLDRLDISEYLQLLAREEIEEVSPVYQLKVRSIDEVLVTKEDDENEKDEEDEKVNIPSVKAKQFYPTVFLEAEVNLGINAVSGKEINDIFLLQKNVELIFNASFTGKDNLEVGIESGKGVEFNFIGELTFEGRLNSFATNESDRFELSELSYEFPLDDRGSIYISTSGNDIDDFNPFFNEDANAAISEFGSENPIDNLVGDVGVQLNYELTDEFNISLGYFKEDASQPKSGLFKGNKSAFLQLAFEPSDRFLLGFTYIYARNNSNLETETGTIRSQLDLERPVIGNSYGIAASFSPSSKLTIGGWVGLTKATVIGLGNADVWNYALTLAFPDLGKEGNLLGIIIGQEPRLTGTSGFTIDDKRSDPNTSLHLELFYSNKLAEGLSLTPGLIWITAPNGDNNNPDLFIFTLRTTFKF
jgi:hypothetical protein